MYLKGHGYEADFLGFFHKPVPHEPLPLHFELFRFALRILGDIRDSKNKTRLPIDKILSKPLNKSMMIVAYFLLHWSLKSWFSLLKFGKSMINFKILNSDSPTHHSDSPTHRVGEFLEKYSDSESLTCRVGELSTPRLAESGIS
jgi:hypothetical protein